VFLLQIGEFTFHNSSHGLGKTPCRSWILVVVSKQRDPKPGHKRRVILVGLIRGALYAGRRFGRSFEKLIKPSEVSIGLGTFDIETKDSYW